MVNFNWNIFQNIHNMFYLHLYIISPFVLYKISCKNEIWQLMYFWISNLFDSLGSKSLYFKLPNVWRVASIGLEIRRVGKCKSSTNALHPKILGSQKFHLTNYRLNSDWCTCTRSQKFQLSLTYFHNCHGKKSVIYM